MAIIYLVRHAESVANTKGIYQGQTYDTSLSPLGIKQAKALARTFKNKKIDRFISSSTKRALCTARYISDGNSILTERGVFETNHGKWEGRTKDFVEKNYNDTYVTWLNTPSKTVFPDGEKFTDTVERVKKFWFDGDWRKDTLIVSHDNVIRIIVSLIKEMKLDDIWKIKLDSASITTVEKGKKKFFIVKLNDVSHLNGLKANLVNHAL